MLTTRIVCKSSRGADQRSNAGRVIAVCELASRPLQGVCCVMRPTPRVLLAALGLFVLATLARAHAPAVDMFGAAQKFLATLSADQAKQATYPLTDAERENWFFTPVPRQGLSLKHLTEAQRDLGLALLRSGLGQSGLLRAEGIRSLEIILKELEKDTPAGRRDPINYFITIFGTPSEKQSWGWRFEGHHLSFNFTLVDGAHVFFAPVFMGTNPAEVRSGPRKGERLLGEEEDLGLALVNSLDAAQRKVAIFADVAPKEIVTTNKKRVELLAPAGIAAAQLTAGQREKLFALVKVYASRGRAEIAAETFAAISKAGLDKVTFAWAGALDRSAATYYRIQGPTFLIEFDNSQNNANHVHSVFRDFKGDFGHDLLAEHYAKEHKK